MQREYESVGQSNALRGKMLYGVLHLVSMVVLCEGYATGQGLLEQVDGEAEDLFLDYVAGPEGMSPEYAYIGRAASFSVRNTGNAIRQAEVWTIEARVLNDEGAVATYSAMSRQTNRPGLAGAKIWEQTLVNKKKRWFRRMATGHLKGSTLSEDEDTELEDSKTRRLTPIFDPYYLPMADTVTYLRSGANKAFAERMITRCELIKGVRKKQGIEGVWKIEAKSPKMWQLRILFDSGQGGMPVRVTWEKEETKMEGDDANGSVMFSPAVTTKIGWQQVEGGGEEKLQIWLPRLMVRTDFYSAEELTEAEYVFLWKEISQDEFPEAEDVDWREPFAKKFELDWNEPFKEFQRRVALKKP